MATYAFGSLITKVPRDGNLTFQDNSAVNTLPNIKYQNLTFSDPGYDKVTQRVRGDICGSRNGDQQYATGSFDVFFYQFTDSGTAQASIIDICDGTGAVGSNWTVADANHEQFTFDMVFNVSGTPYTGAADGAAHVATFSTCTAEWDFSEDIAGDKITVTFEAVSVTYTGPS